MQVWHKSETLQVLYQLPRRPQIKEPPSFWAIATFSPCVAELQVLVCLALFPSCPLKDCRTREHVQFTDLHQDRATACVARAVNQFPSVHSVLHSVQSHLQCCCFFYFQPSQVPGRADWWDLALSRALCWLVNSPAGLWSGEFFSVYYTKSFSSCSIQLWSGACSSDCGG